MSQNPCARPLTSPATWLGFSSDPSEERRRGDGCYGKGWTFRCSTLTCNKCNNYGFLNTHTCIFIHIYIYLFIDWLILFIYLFDICTQRFEVLRRCWNSSALCWVQDFELHDQATEGEKGSRWQLSSASWLTFTFGYTGLNVALLYQTSCN